METFLLHPIAVHFPIVLLPAATLLLVLLLLGKPVERLALWTWGLGVVSAWVALYTGNLAEDHAERVWHVPEALIERHERGAQITLALAVVTFVLVWLGRRLQRRSLVAVALATALLGTGAIVYTGDQGGDIVYKHAIPPAVGTPVVGETDEH